MFITVIVMSCLADICYHDNNELTKVTLNKQQILAIEDFNYYWRKDGKVADNGEFIPNKDATRMRGCFIKMKDKQSGYFIELPCDSYVRPKL